MKPHGEDQTEKNGCKEGSLLPHCGCRLPVSQDGQRIEEIGAYNPLTEPATITVDSEKAKTWIQNGAQPTDTVRGLLKKAGVL